MFAAAASTGSDINNLSSYIKKCLSILFGISGGLGILLSWKIVWDELYAIKHLREEMNRIKEYFNINGNNSYFNIEDHPAVEHILCEFRQTVGEAIVYTMAAGGLLVDSTVSGLLIWSNSADSEKADYDAAAASEASVILTFPVMIMELLKGFKEGYDNYRVPSSAPFKLDNYDFTESEKDLIQKSLQSTLKENVSWIRKIPFIDLLFSSVGVGTGFGTAISAGLTLYDGESEQVETA